MAFGRRAKPAQSKGEDDAPAQLAAGRIETFIDEHSVLSGELRFGEDVRIEGRIEGQIRAEKAVVVGSGAEIDATIEADSLEVHGVVVGDIRVRRGTTLHKSARVEGEIQTAGIVVEEGARFKGCIVIGPEDESLANAEQSLRDPSGTSAIGDPNEGIAIGISEPDSAG